MRASRQSAGTQPSSSERWYIKLSIGDSSSAAALRIKVGIPSGPADLNGRRSLSSFFTPFGLMMMLSIDENGLGPWTPNHARSNKKNYNMKYHVILGRFKWLINVSPSLEGIRYPRSVYVLSFVCFFLLLLLFLYSLEKQFGWFLTHISRLHI